MDGPFIHGLILIMDMYFKDLSSSWICMFPKLYEPLCDNDVSINLTFIKIAFGVRCAKIELMSLDNWVIGIFLKKLLGYWFGIDFYYWDIG